MFADDEPSRPETRETTSRAVDVPHDRPSDPDPRTTVDRLVSAAAPSRDAMLALYL